MTLFCSHREFITHLEAEIVWLRLQMMRERQRAELAINELLRLGPGAQPVSVPLIRDEPVDDPISALLKNSEFTEVGE